MILALPEKENYVIDLEGDLDAFDEPTYVTNSELSFFYKKDQLSTYREQRTPDKTTYFKMSDNIVTTDFTKEDVSIVPDTVTEYTGARSLIMHNGELKEFAGATKVAYTLKGGATVPKEEAFEIILDHGILGHSDRTPNKISRGNTYYAAFTSELEAMYFEFTSVNEFVSIAVDGLKGRVEYTLLNEKMEPIKNGWNNSKSSIEVQYKGKSSARYYLKLVGSYSENLTPYTIKLPHDENEWLWQMEYVDINTEAKGTFNYYGDEDYFVLPPSVTENMNKSVLRFTAATTDINVVVYNKDRTVIGQYVYKPDETDIISLYGLKDAYAVALYSHNGKSSGEEYRFVFEYTEITLLDIETYGFSLKPGFSDGEDYYTASVKSLADKKITDVMHSMTELDVSITVKQQTDDKLYTAKLGEELPLAPGRNIVTMNISHKGVSRQIVIVISDTTYDISMTDFEYTKTKMPESYKDKINALKKSHPNWKFTFVKTNKDFNSYVNSQYGESSIIQKGGSWVNASKEEIAHYVDPRNFLNEQDIFMFEKQIYAEGIYSEKGIKSIWNDDVYASYVMDAAISTGLSPYFIAARAGLESGYGKSPLASGTISGYKGYYNFYGINAVDSNPKNGAVYAKEQNWNSKRRAIIEGAAWVKNQYIAKAQYTIYFMKFCFRPGVEWHQYMTDIGAPKKDASNYYKAHAAGGTLDTEIEFVIPVFENMP